MTDRTAAFFSPPNEIDLSLLDADSMRLLDLLRGRLERGNQRTLLPANIAGTTRWYALAPTHRDGRLLREEVQCWLSRPLITSRVDVPSTSPDPVDQAALGLVPTGSALRVDVAHGWVGRARQNVDSLTTVWSIEPDRAVDQPRPVGRILRQFYESLVVLDREQADAALDELRGRALLSATNLRFLRVELLSSLGMPQDLLDDPLLRDVSSLARPPAVTESLAEAADALFLNSHATDELRSAAARLDVAWPGLVTQAYQVTTPATARCYALGQLLLDRPEAQQLRELSMRYPDDSVITGVLAAADFEQPSAPPYSSPLNLYYDGNYEAALELAASQPPDRSFAAIALAAAANLQDSASAVLALGVVDRLSESDRAGLLKSVVERNFFETLRALTAEDRVPSGWLDWFTGDWPDRPDLLAEWSRAWLRTPDELTSTADDLAVALIEALNDARRPRVRNGIPLFIDWLTSGGVPTSGVGLATTTFDIMLSSEPGKNERQAALSLLDGVLAVGCSSPEYREILGAVARELPVIGPRDGPWLAQVVDLLLLSGCPDPAERAAVIAQAAGVAGSWTDRIDSLDAILLDLLFRNAGVDFENREDARTKDVPPFKSVGVYSLMESAVRVLTAWIQERWPSVTVRSSAAHGNSDALGALVKGVDVMLVQTSHAKHAATGAISMAIEDPSRLVLVSGRGASALMRALLNWAEQATE
ncbi:protein DpdD [Mycolicibacterium sp. CR10]|uniref:protein DpdD n=1 Tax=Mycolicibacterium sp. CR10 TaxID=2562314 RepID=UPI0010BFC138|nr:protein DpdD [Mycolicibacterium sp. CR10]